MPMVRLSEFTVPNNDQWTGPPATNLYSLRRRARDAFVSASLRTAA